MLVEVPNTAHGSLAVAIAPLVAGPRRDQRASGSRRGGPGGPPRPLCLALTRPDPRGAERTEDPEAPRPFPAQVGSPDFWLQERCRGDRMGREGEGVEEPG